MRLTLGVSGSWLLSDLVYKLLQGDIVRSDDELVCQAGEHREGLLLCLEDWEGSQTDTGDN